MIAPAAALLAAGFLASIPLWILRRGNYLAAVGPALFAAIAWIYWFFRLRSTSEALMRIAHAENQGTETRERLIADCVNDIHWAMVVGTLAVAIFVLAALVSSATSKKYRTLILGFVRASGGKSNDLME